MDPQPIRPPGRLRLRIVTDSGPMVEPIGFVLPFPAAIALLARLGPRLAHYPRLRLARMAEDAIVFASEAAPLPWTEAAHFYLQADGALMLPFGHTLDIPGRWRADVVRRLLDTHDLAPPALLLPDGAGLRIVSLAASRQLGAIDLARLAAMIR